MLNIADSAVIVAVRAGLQALALAAGDPNTQAAAWRLIADALRVRGREDEASKA